MKPLSFLGWPKSLQPWSGQTGNWKYQLFSLWLDSTGNQTRFFSNRHSIHVIIDRLTCFVSLTLHFENQKLILFYFSHNFVIKIICDVFFASCNGFQELQFNRGQVDSVPELSWPGWPGRTRLDCVRVKLPPVRKFITSSLWRFHTVPFNAERHAEKLRHVMPGNRIQAHFLVSGGVHYVSKI